MVTRRSVYRQGRQSSNLSILEKPTGGWTPISPRQQRWLDERRALGLSTTTLQAYRSTVHQWHEMFGDQEPTRQLLSQFIQSLHTRGLTIASRNRYLANLKAYSVWLHEQDRAYPVPTMTKPKVPKRLRGYLTPEQCAGLCDTAKASSLRLAALVELLYGSGARIAEALPLKWCDVDLEQRWATVTGKGNKQRMVPFGIPAQRALVEWKAQVRDSSPSGYVFPGRTRGSHLQRDAAVAELQRLGQQVLAKRLTPHMLRHACATHLLEGGADIRVVQVILGHEKPDTTQIYTQVTPMYLQASYHDIWTTGRPRSRRS